MGTPSHLVGGSKAGELPSLRCLSMTNRHLNMLLGEFPWLGALAIMNCESMQPGAAAF